MAEVLFEGQYGFMWSSIGALNVASLGLAVLQMLRISSDLFIQWEALQAALTTSQVSLRRDGYTAFNADTCNRIRSEQDDEQEEDGEDLEEEEIDPCLTGDILDFDMFKV